MLLPFKFAATVCEPLKTETDKWMKIRQSQGWMRSIGQFHYSHSLAAAKNEIEGWNWNWNFRVSMFRAVFNWVSKVISELLWFVITSLNDWFKVLAPLFQPIRSKTKTNRGLRVHIFPRFVSGTCNYFEFWLVYWIVSALFDWPK